MGQMGAAVVLEKVGVEAVVVGLEVVADDDEARGKSGAGAAASLLGVMAW